MYYSIHNSDHDTIADNLTRAEMLAKLRNMKAKTFIGLSVAEWEDSQFGDVLLGSASADEVLHRADKGKEPVPA